MAMSPARLAAVREPPFGVASTLRHSPLGALPYGGGRAGCAVAGCGLVGHGAGAAGGQLDGGCRAAARFLHRRVRTETQARHAASDVVLTHRPESLRLETFAIVQDKKSQEAAAYWESMSSHIMVAELRHNGSVNRSISQKATLAVTGLVFDVRTGRTQLVERRAPLRGQAGGLARVEGASSGVN